MNTYYVKVYNGYRCIYDQVLFAASKNDVLKSLLLGCVLDEYTKILIEE
ncbi:hypothetical protein [Bacillus sp. T33-2]|nr:hypothetical protein [Bacillus sp. T33-2]